MSDEQPEYILQPQSDTPDVEPIGEGAVAEMTDTEREILSSMEELSKKCVDANIPCFICAKFDSQEDTSTAWNFGVDTQSSLQNFFEHFAALFLHVTSKMTRTKITAVNPDNNALVYEVNPDSK